MSEVQRLRDEAARAERWARAMTDPLMIDRLMQLARDYARRADELDSASVPVRTSRLNGRFTAFPGCPERQASVPD